MKVMKQSRRSLRLTLLLSVLLLGLFGASAASAQEQQAAQQETSLFESAQADWNNQEWEQAIAKYRQFVQQFPSHPLAADAHFQLGYYLSYVASPEEAITEYEQAIALAPGTHDAHEAKIGIAALKFWQQDYETAYELFREVIVETQDWSLIKECTYRMKELRRLIQLQKLPEERNALMDCGPKALELVFQKQHINTSEKEMKKLIVLGRGGATMQQLKEAAQSKGLAAWGIKVNAEQLATLPKPFIIHIRPDHFVVVTNTSTEKIEYTDPHRGDTYRTREKFARIWRGYALVFAKEVPSSLRSQVLSKTEMQAIHGGHHLHGMNLGGPSGNPASKFENDPNSCSGPGLPRWSVNLSNYNFLVTDTDFSYSGKGPSVGVTRLYNADDPREGVFGRSWTFNYDVFLVVSPNGSVDVKREDGKVDNFVARGDGTFDPPRWVHDRLIKNADGTYKLEVKNSRLTEFFNAQGKLAQITDRNNNSVTLQYDTGGRLISVTDAVGRDTRFTYNAAGKISQITDPLGRKATFTYDANRNLISTVDMAGNVSTFTYNGASYMTSLTTPSGTTQVRMGTTPHFVEFPGLLKDIIDPLGNTTHFDTGDYIAWVIDARGNQTFYFNDSLGQTTEIEDPLGNKTKATFNTAAGDMTSSTDANGKITNLTYDARGNVTSVTDPLGNSTRFTYDSRDNLTQLVDPANKTYLFQYDGNNNLTKTTNPITGVITYAYDSFGQLTSVTDPRGNTITFTYDSAGNLIKSTNPNAGVTSSTYDGVGRVLSQTDFKNQTFNYTYDGIDRLTSIVRPGGGSTTYTYSCCTITSITDPAGTLSFVHDAAKRVTKFTNERNQTIQYAYDANGNLITLTYPDSKVVRYEYDATDRLRKVTDWLNNTTTYNYDPAGNVISSINSNGTLTGYRYDALNRMVSMVNASINGSVNSAYRFTLNSSGNRTDITATEPISLALPLKNIISTYDADNRIQTVAGTTYTHDGNGNVTSISGANAANYSYDIFDRLIQVTSASNNVQYQYDGLGNRSTRTAGGNTTKYIVNPNESLPQVLAETDNAGNITAYYVYGLGLISKVTPMGQPYYYSYDGNGNTIALTDSSSNVVNKYAYDAFGNLSSNSTETIANPFRYGGCYGVMDEGNGLLYMRARYYLPSIGRFTSKDPIGVLDDSNLYSYVRNNPVAFADPDGTLPIAVVGAVVGGLIDLGIQVTSNILDPCKSWNDINYRSVLISAGIGALTSMGGLPMLARLSKFERFAFLNSNDLIRIGIGRIPGKGMVPRISIGNTSRSASWVKWLAHWRN
jgi:RHS repeat-associated protein